MSDEDYSEHPADRTEDRTTNDLTLDPVTPPSEEHSVPPIAGFWRRLAAFAIDSAILGCIGQLLGWALSSFWFTIGPYGRVVGAIISLAYFGVLGSRVGQGSTLGKRVLRLSVRDTDGRTIGVARSVLRTLVWLVPATLNGWAVPILSNPVGGFVAGIVLFGVGGAVLLTLIFNRRTRQGLHDLLAKTYVLRVSEPAVAPAPVAGQLPWILSGIMLFAAALASVLMNRPMPQLRDVLALHNQLQKDPRFFSASVIDNTFTAADGTETRTLIVRAWCKGELPEAQRKEVTNDLARVVLNSGDRDEFDLIRIELHKGFDLGIASGYSTDVDAQPVSVWKQRVQDERSTGNERGR